ncbi:MAG: ABC transporter permease [Sedimentibacter sp.]|uniref:ABC transporter permease n=1 Tax=Sedimentibacter sp. TaxID=1960295 RepID=UPI002981C9C9|nr:ABC transporter permease [Sedimentibacter sp.]MDW5299126.1 ABC transporter permease [Sedimentibacter sp.]
MFKKFEKLYIFSIFSGIIVLFFVAFPVINTFTWTDFNLVVDAFKDPEIMNTIFRSMKTATITTIISAVLTVPFAYFVVRHDFKGKKMMESIIDIPMVMPHTVAGIALLTVLSPKSFIGKLLVNNGIEVLGTEIAIVIAMAFVSLPLMFDASKEAFKWISPRMENVSRSLGASHLSTFVRVTLPLASKDIVSGMITTWARSISEYGAVIILAYHPMIAPTLIYERYSNYGMLYAVPMAVILLSISLVIFVILRIVSMNKFRRRES